MRKLIVTVIPDVTQIRELAPNFDLEMGKKKQGKGRLRRSRMHRRKQW